MKALLVAVFFFFTSSVHALDNGLALTPPMGWSSWNSFYCDISEDLVKEVADFLVDSGLRDQGYTYVNIDDCWEAGRDENGYIQVDTKKFPSGMKALGDYIHNKGLKFGMYTSSGPLTCQNYTGSYGNWEKDAQSYAEWGADLLKLDTCWQDSVEDTQYSFRMMGDALNATGRPILYLCDTDELILRVNNKHQPWEWAPKQCNTARIWFDIYDDWVSTMEILDHSVNIEHVAAPGYWNDMDILTVGMGKQTTSEYRAQFSLWSLLGSPLILGNDVRKFKDVDFKIISNSEVIAVNQDLLGVTGRLTSRSPDGSKEVWARPIMPQNGGSSYQLKQTLKSHNKDIKFTVDAKGKMIPACPAGNDYVNATDFSIVLFNRATEAQLFTLHLQKDIYGNFLCCPPPMPDVTVTVRDLWAHEELGVFTNWFNVTVAPHDVLMVNMRRLTQLYL